ncbi:serine/threonine protein kinase [Geodermatophilus ruber]|uniref:mitogen-activated protein kinase kinase n=1 Tax=Geodermatophilus ruber TaxID=504800 RepID=A0A1I4A5A9_9ACTN|nr:serine/threonine protein kinase [Geodermatophilus ruber]
MLIGSGDVIQLSRRWALGEQLGKGGFGRVFAATAEDRTSAAVKLVPKEPGASREMLFVDLPGGHDGVRNVVPVLDSGETDSHYAIVMPLAAESLRDRLESVSGPMPLEEALAALTDVATALADLDGRVVHRDLKPENVLLIDGSWCLADFGISRYTEAATATDTHKWSGTAEYLAPERWRSERATAATDVYALGVMAFELMSGELPFPGPDTADFRDQHLHADPPQLAGAPRRLAALVEECLYKAPGARPSPTNLLARLQRAADNGLSPGAAALAGAYQQEVGRRRAEEVAASRALSEQERRRELTEAARRSLRGISSALLEVVNDIAPGVICEQRPDRGWTVQLGRARLGLSDATPHSGGKWGSWPPPAFDVIAHATISVHVPPDRFGYEGRSHSLYFCDAERRDAYGWYETAFMVSPLLPKRGRQDPFALPPGEPAAQALGNGINEFQVAWPFTKLVTGEVEEFIDRWVGWFAAAVDGQVARPSTMPEGRPEGSWRRS